MGKNSTCPKCLVLNYLLFTFTLYLSYYVLSECPTHNFGARVVPQILIAYSFYPKFTISTYDLTPVT